LPPPVFVGRKMSTAQILLTW